MRKRYLFLCLFLPLLFLAGCSCPEKEWRKNLELREELAKKLPDAPDFDFFDIEEPGYHILGDYKKPDDEKALPQPEDLTVVEAKPAVERVTEEVVEQPSLPGEPVKEELVADTEKEPEAAPEAIAKIDIPRVVPPPVPSVKPEPVFPPERAFFQNWVGECLVYTVNWNFVRVGKILLAARETSNGYGDVYHLVAVTSPEGMLSNMGFGYYRIDAYIDRDTLLPQYYYQYSKNRHDEEIMEIRFDWQANSYRWRQRRFDRGTLTRTRADTVKMNNSAHDGISSFYIVRTLDFDKKTSFTVPVALNEMWDLTVSKTGRRRENLPHFGTREVFIIEPEAKNDGSIFTKGKMDVWITADKKRLPVFLEGKVPIGTARMTLAAVKKLSPDTQFNIDTIARLLSQVR